MPPRHLLTGAPGEQLYSSLYGKEIGMMRKMVGPTGEDELKYAAAAAAGFQRGLGSAGHNNIPPTNMIPENMIYNPKFTGAAAASQHSSVGGPPNAQGFSFSAPALPNGGGESSTAASHLHKMESLLKPCYDDQYGGSGYANFHAAAAAAAAAAHHQHSHHHFSGQMMDSSFVNNFKNSPDGVHIKQENEHNFNNNNKTNDVLMFGRSSNGNNPSSSSSANNLSSKEPNPNEFNLNYSGSNNNGKAATPGMDSELGADDSIDKLSGLQDTDSPH